MAPQNPRTPLKAIIAALDRTRKHVFSQQELTRFIDQCRKEGRLYDAASAKQIIATWLKTIPLREVVLAGPVYQQHFTRYLWRDPNPLEVAASVRSPNSYLCHSSALFMHKLTDLWSAKKRSVAKQPPS